MSCLDTHDSSIAAYSSPTAPTLDSSESVLSHLSTLHQFTLRKRHSLLLPSSRYLYYSINHSVHVELLYTYYLGLVCGTYLGTRRGIENLELLPGVVCLEFCSIILAELTNHTYSRCLNVSIPHSNSNHMWRGRSSLLILLTIHSIDPVNFVLLRPRG